MNHEFKVATCPCCTAVIPLDDAGVWIEHTAHVGVKASYRCPGTGREPHPDSVSKITCCDE